MRIIPLSEGSYTVDKTKVFTPIDTDSESIQDRPVGSLLVEIQPFVLVTEKDIILLDTGLGFLTQSGNSQLHQRLFEAGILPSQVTKVLMSHLHKDHAGGVSIPSAHSDDRFISFPYATYYVQKREFDHALSNHKGSYVVADFSLLEEFSKVVWLTEDEGWIDGYIKYQLTGGHSIFHQVFWIHQNGDTVFYGGDVAPQLQQMKSRFIAKYDYDGKKCMELRQQWWQEAKEGKWTFLFYHDIQSPIFRID
ncbi:MAG: MBL fold metallo-hydrolase [Chitinophagaceae bacterium]|nr:MBL fold metallo-hydrolase [Chitinophagaceae bacterium]